ncbi:unnamed protein product [Chilo suppressalis]|uniref:Cilia- and flagella-associated protein 43 n=1 Tax=Chilo suppressalis TaxID=168631 RepID=A0ABN8LAN4_CHISP|nr:unnamed protein product [Chilo suppressalis]
MNYPSFSIVAELRDMAVNRYKGLCMMECELVAGFSGFPNYLVTVWNWRTQQQLISCATGVVGRRQMYMASRTHMLLCECWGEGLIVWEVAQCHKKTLILRRAKEEVKGWDVAEPPLVDVTWSNEGQLYAIDPQANLYGVLSDGIGMVTNLEWSDNLEGPNKPLMCTFGCGLLIYGPDKVIRSLKKVEHKWKIVWTFKPLDEVMRLVGNATCDAAIALTKIGIGYRLTGESEEKIEVKMLTFKQRNITKIQLIAPDYKYIATINDTGVICIYDAWSANLVTIKYIVGDDISFQASPVEPLLAVYGVMGTNYGLMLVVLEGGETEEVFEAIGTDEADDAGEAPRKVVSEAMPVEPQLRKVASMCLTHQIVSLVTFSPTGRELVAAAMSAGHIFIMQISNDYKLTLVRYTELGRGLADCFLMKVGEVMRCFSLVIFSDKYAIGERIICINAETGKDNKFAGKMQGPYARLLPLATPDTMLAVPHLSTKYHILLLKGEKGITVSVKMGPIVESGHQLKQFSAFYNTGALLTFGYDGAVIMRKPDAPEEYELKLLVTHRYENGITQAVIDTENEYVVHLGGNKSVACAFLHGGHPRLACEPRHALRPDLFDEGPRTMTIIGANEKNYLDLQEEKKVREEAMDYKSAREEVLRSFESVRKRLVQLLEENIAERPLHQLSLSEFNLHHEHRKERLKQAEREREELRLQTESRIRAQDKVTAWIKATCWDTMLTPRVKLYAIFSHYQVENYPVLPEQREQWPELQSTLALRGVEMENDHDLFRPWEERGDRTSKDTNHESRMMSMGESNVSVRSAVVSAGSAGAVAVAVASADSDQPRGQPHVLAGSDAHRYVDVPAAMLQQMLSYSYLQMRGLQHLIKLNVQNMRLWFNKQFDELMNQKKREVGLVEERNSRLRFIIDELNKLSDLRGSFHHLVIKIRDPEWRQEEQPYKLIKVDPEECSIAPYISPSQIVIVPPDAGPKDDFRERALMDMMDGVLEKLWHEEIKKPIPPPQCMLEKDPEHFNEDDLRLVFEYEAKVQFRNEERDKYRKMLHAEYAKLSQVLNEGVVKFNQKVKEMWLNKLQVDSVIGQENLILMRLRRTNLDRLEMAEKLEDMRAEIAKYERESEKLNQELQEIQGQSEECQANYDALAAKDRLMERTFKNHFADLSPIIVDQCYKFFKKRPKWHQRATVTAAALHELASSILAGQRALNMHPDCVEYYKSVDQLDLISNMPPVMDEALWATMCRLRRAKIENEIRMRALVQEMAYVDSTCAGWNKAVQARRQQLAVTQDRILRHREAVELNSRNKTIQLVLPAGQVEILTSGHMEDFEDATLIPREEIQKINNLILKVGEMKLRMMRKQMDFRKGILSKEWEHAQMKMKLRHMQEELSSYQRLKIPKELQLYLKNKEMGYTDEMDYVRLEKEMESTKVSVNKVLTEQIRRVEELEVKVNAATSKTAELEKLITSLNVKVSEKRLNEDPLEPIRVRRVFKRRMETLVMRSRLIREVQANHTTVVLLQTELELLRLRTYPTLASFRTLAD